VQATDSQLRPVGDGELTWAECHGQAAIVIEPVSAENLCKTRISADRAGDFRQFRFLYQEIGSLETVSNARKAGISGRVSRTVAKRTTGWGGRNRTLRWRFQKSLLPGGLIRNRRLSPIREIRQLLSGEAHKRLEMIGFQGSY
jgi:hypothetical protein